MVLKGCKRFNQVLCSSSKKLKERSKTKEISAMMIMIILIVSLLMILPTTNDKKNTSTTTLGIRAEKQPAWYNTTGGTVPSVAISSDGSYIFAGSSDGQVYFFDRYGTLLWNYTTGGQVLSVSMSDNGRLMVAGSSDDNVYFFRDTGYVSSYTTGGDVHSVSISPDGPYVAAGSDDGNVYFFYIWGELIWSDTIGSPVRSVDVSHNGAFTAVGVINNVFLYYRNGTLLWISEQIRGFIQSLDISHDGSYIAIASDGALSFFNRAGYMLWDTWLMYSHLDFQTVSISSDGNYIAAGGYESEYFSFVYFFNRDGSLLWSYSTREVWSVEVSADGNYIAAGTGLFDFKVFLFDSSGSLLWSYSTNGYVYSVAISSDGSYVVAGSNDNNVYFFDHGPPSIDHPDDVTYGFGTTGHNITWNPSDYYPSHYNITRNGIIKDSISWNGSSITKNVDGLSLGTHIFVCTVYDTSDNSANDTVVVTVIDASSPNIDHPDDVSYEEDSTGHTITWNPSDAEPSSFMVTRDGVAVVGGPWDGGSITVSVDGLSVGTYSYVCTVYDVSSNSASDSVMVTVTEIEDTSTPTIDEPEDITYREGETGHNITWNPSDDYPVFCTITRDGVEIFGGPWDGSPITVNVDMLVAGEYTYTCIITDIGGNSASDSVTVTVEEVEEEFPWLWAGVGIVAIVAGIGAAILYFKKE